MEALTFLQTVAAATRAQTDGSADKPLLIGTVDAAYVSSTFPGTMPKVTFDGESTLSGKTYTVILPGYRPSAGDRVVLVPIGTTYAIIGSVTPGSSGYVGGTLTVAGALSVTGALTVGGVAPAAYVEYGQVTSGIAATSISATEVAIPTATWAHEPSMTFVNGRMYRVDVQYGIGETGTTAIAPGIKLRKGAQTIVGQVLGFTTLQPVLSSLSFHAGTPFTAFVQNVSGANITTALSLSIAGGSGTNNVRLYGDTSAVRLNITVQDAGLASGHALASVAVSIV
jgi:hypothetical protein